MLIERRPSRLKELAALTTDDDWLVTQRALDLLEKLAHEHPDWVEPYKTVFIGPLAESDKWKSGCRSYVRCRSFAGRPPRCGGSRRS